MRPAREGLPRRIRRQWRRTRGGWKNLSRRTALLTLSLVLLALVLGLSIAWSKCFFQQCPDVASLGAYQPGRAPVLLDRHGEVFADLTPVERDIIPLFSLPSHVPQAFLAVEDQRFYSHHGVDWRRVGGAVAANVKAGGLAQGFSTISMQLARNLFPERIPGEEQSLARKLLEIRVARQIESEYSKPEILELYLNHIYFGNRARGIEAAAQQYFSVPATQLTLPQAALLAALPKAPSHYDPRRYPEKARERRNLVLALMEEQGRVPKAAAEEARQSPLGLSRTPARQERVEAGLAPYFVDQVRQQLEERFGRSLYSQPLRIRTTLDSSIQRAAEEELRRQLRRIEDGALGDFEGPRYTSAADPSAGPGEAPDEDGTPYLQGAAVVLDVERGDVLAWVGGRDFSQSQFDRVSLAHRQAGSAFKPFVYAAALTEGYVLSQPLEDQPLSVRLANGQVWRPRNDVDEYEGRITVRDALVRSKNVATVRLAEALGLGAVAAVAQRAGVEPPHPLVPAVALGTGPVSPLALTSAYTAFAGLGRAAEPRLILSVETEDKKVLWRPEPKLRQVIDPGVAFLITDVLSEALERGTGVGARQSGLKAPAAGKTGTTDDGADAWFVGYTPDLAAGVWIGFDQPRPIVEDASGGRLAAPVWGNLIRRAYRVRLRPEPWARPPGVVALPVDPATGLVVEKGCAPTSGQAREELFLEKSVPAAYCPGKERAPRNGFPIDGRQPVDRPDSQAVQQAQAKAKAAREAEIRKQEAAATAAAAEQARLAEQRRQDRQAATQRQEQETVSEQKEQRAKELRERQARIEKQERELEEREEAIRRAEKEKEQEADREVDEREAREERAAREEREEEAEREDEPEPREERAVADLTGWWELTNRIDSTNYPAYKGLRLTYRLQLEQDGGRIEGRGQKWAENGRTLPAGARTPISVTGTVNEDGEVELHFTERGARRSTSGGFSWELSANRTALRGSFRSNAANASGSSTARRMP